MSPSAIGPVKLMMRSLEVGPLRNYIGEMLRQPHVSIRHELAAYARDHGVTL
jgi:Signal transduction protein containing GAF and PtsI domains